ncbi:MAG: DUF6516 family protein [Flavobacteriales bacterium]|nr:DUF6516 family protein [Flavobacteriales bacterium]
MGGHLRNATEKQRTPGRSCIILDYFEELERVISEFLPIISSHSTTTKVYGKNKGFIRGEIVFSNGHQLSFAEVVDLEQASKMKYRYHLMDENGALIFRYDNAPHFPNLKTFPNHKNLPNDVLESEEPNLPAVLMDIFNLNFKRG